MWSGRPLAMDSIILVILFWLLLVVSCGYALWRGRKYERIAALICILATVLSIVGHMLVRRYQPDYSGVEVGDLVVDGSMLAAFILIALRSDRFWPLWVAGLQLTISISHLLKAAKPDLLPMAYGAAERFWSYPILAILFVAAWRQQRRMTSQHPETAVT